jgi:hypothetical protein
MGLLHWLPVSLLRVIVPDAGKGKHVEAIQEAPQIHQTPQDQVKV